MPSSALSFFVPPRRLGVRLTVPLFVLLSRFGSPLAQADVPSTSPGAPGLPSKQPADEYWWTGRFDRVRFSKQSATHYFLSPPPTDAEPFFFFPPSPPPLGAEIPVVGPLLVGAPASPPSLAAFVNEPFYSPLAAQLASDTLSSSLEHRLQLYRAAKLDLQNEIRSALVGLDEAELPVRQQKLAALATAEASRLSALESTAEQLRADLCASGFAIPNSGADDWDRLASAHLRMRTQSPAVPADLQRQATLARGSAYFQDGLSPAQRRLLREFSSELDDEARGAAGVTQNSPDSRLLYFSPATSRIQLPAALPVGLETQIAAYTSEKRRLKNELIEALQKIALTGGARSEGLRQLASAQAPRFDALEKTAEEIRAALSTLPAPSGPPASPALPLELMSRITAYRAHKVEILQTLHAMLSGDVSPPDPTSATGIDRTHATPAALVLTRDGTGPSRDRPLGAQQSVADFRQRQAQLFAGLATEETGIRKTLSEFALANGQPRDRKSIDDLLKDFEHAREEQEIWVRYRDYRWAVLLPCLTPEQRRILFDGAVEALSLPLPPGEPIR